jgi:hypothetical protein
VEPGIVRIVFGALLLGALWIVVLRSLDGRIGRGTGKTDLLLLSLLTSLALISVIGLLLAFAGLLIFPVAAAAIAAAAVTLGMTVPSRGAGGAAAPEDGHPAPASRSFRQALPFLILIAAGIFLYAHPDENIAGNWDPGVYLAQGAALARGGHYRFPDTASPGLTAAEKEVIYPLQGDNPVKYPGFFVSAHREHRLDPQFYPLYPLWTALAQIFGSFSLALALGGLCALFSLFLVMKIGSELAGRTGAFASGLLFLLNPFQIWFSGFHTAEVPMQLLFLAGTWCWLLYRREERDVLALLAGLFFTLTAFTGIAGHFLALLAGVLHLIATRQPRGVFAYFVPYLVLAPLSLWQNLSFSSLYLSQAGAFLPAARSAAAGPWMIGTTALGILLLLALRLIRVKRWQRHSRKAFGVGLVLLTGVLAVLLTDTLYSGGFQGSRLTFAAIVMSKSNLLFSIVGFLLLLLIRPGVGLFLGVLAFAFTYLFSEQLMMEPVYPWAAKRLLVVTLPVLCLAAGVFWARTLGLFRGGLKVVVILFMIAFSLRPLYRGWDFAYHRDWRGLTSFTEGLARRIPDDSLVLAPRWLATPLEFIHGRKVLPLSLSREDDGRGEVYRALVERLNSAGEQVLVVGEEEDIRRLALTGEVLHRDLLSTTVLEQSRRPVAGAVKRRDITVIVVEAR